MKFCEENGRATGLLAGVNACSSKEEARMGRQHMAGNEIPCRDQALGRAGRNHREAESAWRSRSRAFDNQTCKVKRPVPVSARLQFL